LAAAVLFAAAAPLPRVTLFTALPLMWGEGDPVDILSGRAKRSAILDGLDVRAIDTVTAVSLGSDVLVVAQPRAMMPEELVALDDWVRRGGRAAIFADPLLKWPSRYALGDPRRAPPVTLLDPLLAHWGVTLEPGPDGTGQWNIPAKGAGACTPVDAVTIDCRVGKGRALLVADADLLDARVADGRRFRDLIRALAANRGIEAESGPAHWLLIAAMAATPLVFAGLWWRRRRTENERERF
jgi:ABC-type uncharacterized transport system